MQLRESNKPSSKRSDRTSWLYSKREDTAKHCGKCLASKTKQNKNKIKQINKMNEEKRGNKINRQFVKTMPQINCAVSCWKFLTAISNAENKLMEYMHEYNEKKPKTKGNEEPTNIKKEAMHRERERYDMFNLGKEHELQYSLVLDRWISCRSNCYSLIIIIIIIEAVTFYAVMLYGDGWMKKRIPS